MERGRGRERLGKKARECARRRDRERVGGGSVSVHVCVCVCVLAYNSVLVTHTHALC